MALSLDLRQRAVAAIASGMSVTQASTLFGVSRATLYRWLERHAQDDLAPHTPPGGKRKMTAEQEMQLEAQLQQNPDATIAEHLALWRQHGQHGQHGQHHESRLPLSASTMRRAIIRRNWTRKKRA
jgi:transposase